MKFGVNEAKGSGPAYERMKAHGRRLREEVRRRGERQRRGPQHVPGEHQHLSAGHAGRRLRLVRRLPDAAVRRGRPDLRPQRRVADRRAWATPSRRPRPPRTASSTSCRSTTTRGRSSTASRHSTRTAGRRRRRTTTSWRSMQEMQGKGVAPFAFGDKDGWPAMGTFDILNMRHQRLRLPHEPDGRRRGLGRQRGQEGVRDLEGPAALPPGGPARPDLAGGRHLDGQGGAPG